MSGSRYSLIFTFHTHVFETEKTKINLCCRNQILFWLRLWSLKRRKEYLKSLAETVSFLPRGVSSFPNIPFVFSKDSQLPHPEYLEMRKHLLLAEMTQPDPNSSNILAVFFERTFTITFSPSFFELSAFFSNIKGVGTRVFRKVWLRLHYSLHIRKCSSILSFVQSQNREKI